MICHKLSRIANGDPFYADSWHDIAGYSQLVVNILEEAEQRKNQSVHPSYDNADVTVVEEVVTTVEPIEGAINV